MKDADQSRAPPWAGHNPTTPEHVRAHVSAKPWGQSINTQAPQRGISNPTFHKD